MRPLNKIEGAQKLSKCLLIPNDCLICESLSCSNSEIIVVGVSGEIKQVLLLDYLKEALQFEDAITVIVSDHGNSKADLVLNQFPFGHFQRFHPFLMVIPPPNWTDFFTREEMENLKVTEI